MNKILLGALAGLAATVPMTILMVESHRRLPKKEKYPLAPREIFDEVTERVEVDDDLTESEKTNLSLGAHFAYGTTTGAIYGMLPIKHNAANGVAYGLGVWAVSYLGWLPAMEILRPATEHPARRNALMIAAHVVWGASLGAMVGEIEKRIEGEN